VAGDPPGRIGPHGVLLGGDAEDVELLHRLPGLGGQALGHGVPAFVADELRVDQARLGVERFGQASAAPQAPTGVPATVYWAAFGWSTARWSREGLSASTVPPEAMICPRAAGRVRVAGRLDGAFSASCIESMPWIDTSRTEVTSRARIDSAAMMP